MPVFRLMRRCSTRMATCLGVVALVLAVPATSLAHEGTGLGQGDTPRDPAAAAVLDAEQREALATLPPETADGSCRTSLPVEGLGRACRSDDGLFRVVVSPGVTIETHGGDAPAAEAEELDAAHLPDSAAALADAAADDVHCVAGVNDRRVELVYAYPANRSNRSATITPLLRQSLYEASAFLDAESRAHDPHAGRRIPTRCDGDGVPIVTSVQLPALTGGGVFGTIVRQLNDVGFPVSTATSSHRSRYLVFYDAPSASGAAGVGQYYDDDRPGSDNFNNYGARYAVEFGWSSPARPHWDVLLHETSHNMGAVSDAAPDSSLGGHCNDGLDIMCYSDGGPASVYTTTSCVQERYDCGGDSYFNPDPAADSWLATHWNLASPANDWLRPWEAGWQDGGVPDLDPPTAPGTPTVIATGHTSLGATWAASTDARSSVSYVVRVDSWNGTTWTLDSTHEQLTAPSAALTGLDSGRQYRVRVAARDEAGNDSAESSATAATSSGPPSAPASVTVVLEEGPTIAASWGEGSATSAVAAYDVELQTTGGSTLVTRRQQGRSLRFVSLATGRVYRVRVRTIADDGQASVWRSSVDVATGGVLAGGPGTDAAAGRELPAPTVTVTGRTSTTITIAWSAVTGAVAWEANIFRTDGSSFRGRSGLTLRSYTFTGLTPGREHRISVSPRGADGGSGGETTLTARTRADTARPGTVKVTGKARGARAWRLAWAAARDDVGIARYEVQRRSGRSWKRIGTASRSARSFLVADVTRGRVMRLRVRAVDTSGNHGAWATYVVRRR
ncbi:MAG: ricin lectin [Thermoleophilia bacterium]|nr:ricin lectin [Thermoleophilia bacterium]